MRSHLRLPVLWTFIALSFLFLTVASHGVVGQDCTQFSSCQDCVGGGGGACEYCGVGSQLGTCQSVESPCFLQTINPGGSCDFKAPDEGGFQAPPGNGGNGFVSKDHHRLEAAIALLVIWSCIGVTLLGLLAVMAPKLEHRLSARVRSQPNHQLLSMTGRGLMTFVLLTIFVLFLAGLAADAWSQFPGGYYAGATSFNEDTGRRGTAIDYDCSGTNGGAERRCRIIEAAGALTLIFGLIAVITSFAALLYMAYLMFRKYTDGVRFFRVIMLTSLATISGFTALLIWSTCGHLAATAIGDDGTIEDVDLSVSWGLFIAASILACVQLAMMSFAFTMMDYARSPMEVQKPTMTGATNTGVPPPHAHTVV